MPQDYDVCLSFAGEQRSYVEQVANVLAASNVRVFYDGYEPAGLWGKNLHKHLDDVYRNRARFCVIFASKEYGRKVWTKHELASAQARALRANTEYVLPARFDDTEIPGLNPDIGYLDLRSRTPNELAELILKKLNDGSPDTVFQSKVVFSEEPRESSLPARLRSASLRYRRLILAVAAAISIGIAAFVIATRSGVIVQSPSVSVASLTLADPDSNPTNYAGALRIKVPIGANGRVTVGLARWVENAVIVTDDSGRLYQSWGTAIAHNIDTDKALEPGKTYYVSSWHKKVADKGDTLPWYPSVQQLQRTATGTRASRTWAAGRASAWCRRSRTSSTATASSPPASPGPPVFRG